MPSVPPPPITGPLTIAPSNAAPPTFALLHIWRWNADSQAWEFIQWLQIGWDSWPAGYYVTSHLALDGLVDWGPHSQVIQVVSRTRPDGTAAPYVLEPPPADAAQSSDCPSGFYLTDIGNQFGEPGPLCALFGKATVPACPPGSHWDPLTETCVADIEPPPPIVPIPPEPPNPPNPPNPPPPVLGQPDLDGDSITYELCTQLWACTNQIVQAVQQLQQQQGQGPEPLDVCCTAVVSAIGGITSVLTLIFNQLSSSLTATGKPLDLTAIVTELTCLCTAMQTIAAAPPLDLQPLTAALDGIRDAIANAAGSDVSGIVAQLKRSNDDLQVTEDWKTQLINSGAVPLDLVPLLQSTTFLTAIAEALHTIGWILGVGLKDATSASARLSQAIFTPIGHFIKLLLGEIALGFDLGAGDTTTNLAKAAKAFAKTLDGMFTAIFGGAFTEVLALYESDIAGIDTSTEDGVVAVSRVLFGHATEFALAAHVTALLGELPYFSKNLNLDKTAEMLVELAAFHEVIGAVHRPFLDTSLARPAGYAFNRKYPTALPAGATALGLWARRKLLNADMAHLTASSGLSPTYMPALQAGAYRPLSARALATLTLDQPFDTATMREILEDNAMSPDHVNFMLTLLEYNSTKNVRASYVSEAETAYKSGVLGDDELNQILGDIGWSTAAISYVKSKVLLQRRITLASEVEKQVIPLVVNGNISADQGLQQLEAAGVQDWYAQLVVTLATTKAEIHAAKLEAAAEAKVELQRQRNLTRASVAEFQRGALDTAGLTAALIAIGLDPTLVASVVAVQDATRTGKLRLKFGQLLLPQDAKILSDRVSAIEDQFKKQLITLDQARAQLLGLNIDAPEINGLLATWAAMITAATKTGYLVNPLTGQRSGP